MTRIASAVPGRIRLRDHALRRAAVLERLRAVLAALPAALSVECNAVAGSVVLRYDVAQVERQAFEAQVEAAADAVLAARPPTRTHSVKRRVNRYAKYGMLGGLATSLALAAAGKKRWHALSGGLFVACLGVHVAIHRRHLLK